MTGPAHGVVPDVTSTRNPAVVETAKLRRSRERKRRAQTLLEGPNLLRAAIAAGHRPEVVFALAEDDEARRLCLEADFVLRTVSESVLGRLAPTETPRGPIAVLNVPDPSPLPAADTVVMLGVGDPGNAGTLIRSAAAFDFRVASGRHTVDVWAPKTLRAGAGAHFAVGLSALGVDPVDELQRAGLTVAAAVPSGGEVLAGIEDTIALLIGNEPGGLPEEVVTAADVRVSIPMDAGVESLNAAVAGSILMYERARSRKQAS